MKVFLKALALTLLFTAPAVARSGNITGSETRGEPLNAGPHGPAIDPETGYSPGYNYRAGVNAKAKAQKASKKKKRAKDVTR